MTRALGLALLLALLPARAAADAVDVLDPELARICGGSAHDPNCTTSQVGGACCCFGFVGLAGLGVLLATRQRERS